MHAQEPHALELHTGATCTGASHKSHMHAQEPHTQEPHALEPHTQETHTEEPHALEPHAQEPNTPEPGGKTLLPLHSQNEGQVRREAGGCVYGNKLSCFLITMEPGDGLVDFSSHPTILTEIKLQAPS